MNFLGTQLLVLGIVWHLFADWLLQNDWMARNKANYVPWPPRPKHEGDGPILLFIHPAGWVHAGIHLVGLLLIFPWWMAGLIATSHLLIDTRIPLQWWRKFYRQTMAGDIALHVAIWSDQVAHITILAIAALIVGWR